MFALLNPDKWSVSIDLRKPAGVELVLRLADWADVVRRTSHPARWTGSVSARCSCSRASPR